MHNPNRDILVLFKQDLMTPQALEHEVSMLHEMLYHVERLENIIISHELLDLNKHKLLSLPMHLKSFFRRRKEVPFVFLNNKN